MTDVVRTLRDMLHIASEIRWALKRIAYVAELSRAKAQPVPCARCGTLLKETASPCRVCGAP